MLRVLTGSVCAALVSNLSRSETDMSIEVSQHLVTHSSNGPLRRWLRAAIKKWQRRKMIASLSSLDDRTLHDIGIHRSEITRAVDGLDSAEGCVMLKHAPLLRRTAPQNNGGLKASVTEQPAYLPCQQ